jgi:recombination protein RecT
MNENTQLATLRGIISGDKMRQQFAAALPRHLTAERFCRIALTALSRTPKLADCTQESLMRCLLDLSALGIEPDGRRAHLIPYGNQCTLVVDWKGLAELAMRSGIIAKLHADIVCENDVFDYNLGEIVRHEVNFKKPRGEMFAAYAMAVTKDGPVFVSVLTKEEIDAVRKRSRAGNNGPWVSDYNEMAKKTAFRRLSKWLPLSAEFRDALEADADEREIDVTNSVQQASESKLFASALPAPAAVVESEAAAPSNVSALKPVEQVMQLLKKSNAKWSEVVGVLLRNGVIAEEYASPENASDAELADVVHAWDNVVKILKKGGSK